MALSAGKHLELWEPLAFPRNNTFLATSASTTGLQWNYKTDTPKLYAFTNGVVFSEYDCLYNSWGELCTTGFAFQAANKFLEYDLSANVLYLGATGTDHRKFTLVGRTATTNLTTPTTKQIPVLIHPDTTRHASGDNDLIFSFDVQQQNNNQKYSISGNSWSSVAQFPVNPSSLGSVVWLPSVDATKFYLIKPTTSYGTNALKYSIYPYTLSSNTWGSETVVDGYIYNSVSNSYARNFTTSDSDVYLINYDDDNAGTTGGNIIKISNIATTPVATVIRQIPNYMITDKFPEIQYVKIGTDEYLYLYSPTSTTANQAIYKQFYRTLLF